MLSFILGAVLVVDLNINISVGDLNQFARSIEEALGAVTHISGPLVEEAETIRAASMEIVPVDQGILRNSAMEVGLNVEQDSQGISVAFGYGGAAAQYAVKQHETPPNIFRHTDGKTWKYLERPVMDAIPGMGERLAARLARRIEEELR